MSKEEKEVKKCKHCKWWKKDSELTRARSDSTELEEQGWDIGWCLRYPPIFQGKIGATGSVWESGWPKTDNCHYCGEFTQK